MYQIVTTLNQVDINDEDLFKTSNSISLRGYNEDIFITGELLIELQDKKMNLLSVSNIADIRCPKRRDLYFTKGVERLPCSSRQRTWDSYLGDFAEQNLVESFNYIKDKNIENSNYSLMIQNSKESFRRIERNDKLLQRLNQREEESSSIEEGETQRILDLLEINYRQECCYKLLNDILKEDLSIDDNDIIFSDIIDANSPLLGISINGTPDIVIPKHKIIGDIKTGNEFISRYQLTCTGYALAYENQHNTNIDFGIIYLFPTRNPSLYVKPISFAQVYLFEIDDVLRNKFQYVRDRAYRIILNEKPPALPKEKDTYACPKCGYLDHCLSCGLILDE